MSPSKVALQGFIYNKTNKIHLDRDSNPLEEKWRRKPSSSFILSKSNAASELV